MPYKDIERRRAYGRAYNKEYEKQHPQRRRESNDAYKARIKAEITAYKVERGCYICKEGDPVCLDLHHRDPQQKELNPANMWNRGWGPPRVAAELAKCDVICANCHRKLHRKEREAVTD
jgi:hypothetical protein